MGYLLFGCQFDEHNGRLMLWKEILAEVTGEDCNNFPAITFLKDFQRNVMSPATFDWSECNPFRSKCRHLTVCIWPEPVQAALPDEQAKPLA